MSTAKRSTKSWFISTSIPYVNARPHLGFALELIQADVLARHRRAQGYDVRFLSGTDENSLKNVLAARARGVTTRQLVDENAFAFESLLAPLDISVDDFIRTSVHRRHRHGVVRLWNACLANGDIYQRHYHGRYCIGCEAFYTDSELLDGTCPEHGTRAETVSEKNYFFRLSRYSKQLESLIENDELEIRPASRRNETLRFLRDGLEDISISRSQQRAHGWGIEVPGDSSQVVYVWFDALSNYITALDYSESAERYQRYWLDNPNRTHVVGKGITRFHALYWPAILLSAGEPLPSQLLVHGYVTVDGRKISKSLGNGVEPGEVVSIYGTDAVRYFTLRHIRTSGDGDFSVARLKEVYHGELANQLGNLANRTWKLLALFTNCRIPSLLEPQDLAWQVLQHAINLKSNVDAAVDDYRLDVALDKIWEVVHDGNRYVADVQPWAVLKSANAKAPDKQRQVGNCLHVLATVLLAVGWSLRAFLPSTADKILTALGVSETATSATALARIEGNTVQPLAQLFPRLPAP